MTASLFGSWEPPQTVAHTPEICLGAALVPRNGDLSTSPVGMGHRAPSTEEGETEAWAVDWQAGVTRRAGRRAEVGVWREGGNYKLVYVILYNPYTWGEP